MDQSLPVRIVKLIRDYGAVIFVAGLVLTFAPALTIWFVAAFTVVNFGFLLARHIERTEGISVLAAAYPRH